MKIIFRHFCFVDEKSRYIIEIKVRFLHADFIVKFISLSKMLTIIVKDTM